MKDLPLSISLHPKRHRFSPPFDRLSIRQSYTEILFLISSLLSPLCCYPKALKSVIHTSTSFV